MAAIIAQLTRAARGRRTRRTYGANKCLYTLQPFDRNGFNPAIHNKSGSTSHGWRRILFSRYCLEKARWEEYVQKVALEEEMIQAMWREAQVQEL